MSARASLGSRRSSELEVVLWIDVEEDIHQLWVDTHRSERRRAHYSPVSDWLVEPLAVASIVPMLWGAFANANEARAGFVGEIAAFVLPGLSSVSGTEALMFHDLAQVRDEWNGKDAEEWTTAYLVTSKEALRVDSRTEQTRIAAFDIDGLPREFQSKGPSGIHINLGSFATAILRDQDWYGQSTYTWVVRIDDPAIALPLTCVIERSDVGIVFLLPELKLLIKTDDWVLESIRSERGRLVDWAASQRQSL